MQESIFSANTIASFPQGSVSEPEPKYEKGIGRMSAPEMLEYLDKKDERYFKERERLMTLLEEKERNHYEERSRLLGIIERLTKN